MTVQSSMDSAILNTHEANSNDVIIAGDFNIYLLKVNDKHVFSDYFDMLKSHSFYPKITLPTRALYRIMIYRSYRYFDYTIYIILFILVTQYFNRYFA